MNSSSKETGFKELQKWIITHYIPRAHFPHDIDGSFFKIDTLWYGPINTNRIPEHIKELLIDRSRIKKKGETSENAKATIHDR